MKLIKLLYSISHGHRDRYQTGRQYLSNAVTARKVTEAMGKLKWVTGRELVGLVAQDEHTGSSRNGSADVRCGSGRHPAIAR